MSALLSGLPFMMEILGMFLNNPHSRSKKVIFPTMMMWRRSAYGMFEALMINNDNGCGHNWLLSTQLVISVEAKNTNLQKNRNVCQESYLSLINSKPVFIIFFVFWKWCMIEQTAKTWAAWQGSWAQGEDCRHRQRYRSRCVRQTWSPWLLACRNRRVCCVNGQSMTDHEELVNFRWSTNFG